MSDGPYLSVPPAAKVARVLAGCIAFLVVVHLVTYWLNQYGYGFDQSARLFDLDQESNVSTWFSSFLLASAAAVSFAISRDSGCRGTPAARGWIVLSLVLAFMSVDETATIHETFGPGITEAMGFKAEGVLLSSWVVAGMVAAAVVTASLGRFVFRLPRRIRRLAILSAVIYLLGAVACEMVFSLMVDKGVTGWLIRLEMVFEETMEMVGVTLWIYTQLLYLHDMKPAATD